jgi:hypothetical protein
MAQVDRNVDRVDFVEETVIYLQLCFYQFLVPHKVFITEFVNNELKQVLCESRVIGIFFVGLAKPVVSLIDCKSNFDVVLEQVQLEHSCQALVVNFTTAMMMVSVIIFVVRVHFIQTHRDPARRFFIHNRHNYSLSRRDPLFQSNSFMLIRIILKDHRESAPATLLIRQ